MIALRGGVVAFCGGAARGPGKLSELASLHGFFWGMLSYLNWRVLESGAGTAHFGQLVLYRGDMDRWIGCNSRANMVSSKAANRSYGCIGLLRSVAGRISIRVSFTG